MSMGMFWDIFYRRSIAPGLSSRDDEQKMVLRLALALSTEQSIVRQLNALTWISDKVFSELIEVGLLVSHSLFTSGMSWIELFDEAHRNFGAEQLALCRCNDRDRLGPHWKNHRT